MIYQIDKELKLNNLLKAKYDKFKAKNPLDFIKVSQKLKVNNDNGIVTRDMTLNGKLKNIHLSNAPIIIKYNFDTKEFTFSCRYCNHNYLYSEENYICHHTYFLYEMYNNKLIPDIYYEQELDNEFNKEVVKVEAEIRKQKIQRSLNNLNSLIEYVNVVDKLALETKVSIEPTISISLVHSSDFYYNLGLKVGQNKKYVVKNLNTFLSACQNGDTLSYGKGLSFEHSLFNFDETSQEFLSLLMSWVDYTDDYYPRKEINLNPSMIDKIFKLYKSKNINVVDIYDCKHEAYCLLDEVKPQIYIENNKLESDISETPLFIGYETDYILKNGCILKLEKNESVLKIVEFLAMKKSLDFSYIKDEFYNKFFARFSDVVKPDEDFVKEYKIKDYTIEAYLDYDDSITLKTKYLVEGEEQSVDVIKEDLIASQKMNKYLSIIKNLGFSDNEITDDQQIGTFLKTDLTKLKEVASVYLSERLKSTKVSKMKSVTFTLGYDAGMLKINFSDLEYNDEDLKDILNGLKRKKKYVKLKNKSIIKIDTDDAYRLLNTVNEFNLDSKHLTKEQHIPLYQSLKLLGNTDDFATFSTDDILKKILYDISHYKEQEFSVPSVLKDVMRDYQIDAYKWMKTLVKYKLCGILADDMGLGKTLEVISLILDDPEPAPSLIVCPKSLSFNWTNEFLKWHTGIKVVNVCGTSQYRASLIDDIKSDEKVVYVSSYDSLKNDLKSYASKKFKYMILDEAQFIKNNATLKAKSVKEINSEIRFVLTGTPIENTVVDLWSLFDFLMPNYLYSLSDFKKEYEQGITKHQDSELISQLVKKITPFILRRTKEDVLKDLPEKIETIRFAEMGEKQRKLYEAEHLRTLDSLKDAKNKIQILASLTRLRQICVDPNLYLENYDGDSAKMDLCLELVKEFTGEGHKMLIFSQFTTALDILAKKLDKEGISYSVITGATDALERVKLAEEFNQKKSLKKVFLISLKAGGTGLNLVGADIVVHLDPWWNVAAQNQASDRAHRIGQKNIVKVIKLVCERTIEQKVIELQELKKKVIEEVIADNDENIIKLDTKDLSYLLG